MRSHFSAAGGSVGKAAFGRDTPSVANGVPTIAIPAGVNAHGRPVNIQLMGRAWDDAKLTGCAYAFVASPMLLAADTFARLRYRRCHGFTTIDDDDDARRERSRNDDDDDWDRWRKK